MSVLKCLTLIIQGILFDDNLFNGYKWHSFISEFLVKLTTFNFHLRSADKMKYLSETVKSILASYTFPWWLSDKKWFVAVDPDTSSLMTIPHFAPAQRNDPCCPFKTTAPDCNWFYSCVNQMDLSQIFLPPSLEKHYHYLIKLSIKGVVTVGFIENLETYIDLQHVRHFKIDSMIDIQDQLLLQTLARFIMKITHLVTIDIVSCHLLQYLVFPLASVEEFNASRCCLTTRILNPYQDIFAMTVRPICLHFPNLKFINILCNSSVIMRYLINHLVHLEMAIFNLDCIVCQQDWYSDGRQTPVETQPFPGRVCYFDSLWFSKYTRLQPDDFECRRTVDRSLNTSHRFPVVFSCQIVLWINSDIHKKHNNIPIRHHLRKKCSTS